MSVKIKFKDPERDEITEILGPYEWVQITRSTLRVAPIGAPDDEIVLAYYDADNVKWVYNKRTFSDVIIL